LTEITDLSLGRALKSLWFDHAVLHATPIKEGIDPIAAGARPLAISAAGQRRLQKEIIASFAQTSGNLAPLHGITHGNGDKFFRATGRFHPFRTCNVWVGTNLRRAGIKTGIAWVFVVLASQRAATNETKDRWIQPPGQQIKIEKDA